MAAANCGGAASGGVFSLILFDLGRTLGLNVDLGYYGSVHHPVTFVATWPEAGKQCFPLRNGPSCVLCAEYLAAVWPLDNLRIIKPQEAPTGSPLPVCVESGRVGRGLN